MDAKEIKLNFDKLYPSPKCELEYTSPYELLVAVILSAQCTDKQVNEVTKELFKVANTPEKMIMLTPDTLENLIHSCGFYHNKAKNILNMSRELVEKYNGQVPEDKQKLEALAGVGRKTANVVIGEAFGGDAIAVDTHVKRVSNRLGLADTDDPLKVEEALMKVFPKESWSKLHLQMVHFGRYKCKAKNPECADCCFKEICKDYINFRG